MAKKKPAPEPPPPLRLEWRSPAELAENPRNWRRHPEAQIAALGDVLGEVGWAGACLYNERTGRLIDGHARKKVAVEQGCEKVPVLVGSWDEAAEAKILATLDPLGAMAEADSAALDALLRDVQTGSQAIGDMLTDMAIKADIVPRLGATTAANDPNAEWQGMPECESKDQSAWKTLHVHFKNADDLKAFAEIVGQPITEHTRAIWHPQAVTIDMSSEAYRDEP